VRGRVRVQGVAAVVPGDLVELAGVGGRFGGKATVAGVRHEIDTRNWETDIGFGIAPDAYAETRRAVESPGAAALLPTLRGLQVGLVTALEGDPGGESRIQVRLPVVDPDGEGVWARLACADAGSERGMVFRPEIDDEVVVGFLGDDPRQPVVLGQLHSSAKAPPIAASDDNHEKGVVTRSGMKLVFDDDKKTVLIETPGGNSILVSDEDGAITFADSNGNKLVLDAEGITLESAADVNIKASGDVKTEGANVNASASAQLKIEGSGGAELSSGGSTVVKGSLVQIN
jgi:Rhs element Vgr protein